jgi:hypothetical protein
MKTTVTDVPSNCLSIHRLMASSPFFFTSYQAAASQNPAASLSGLVTQLLRT